MDVILGDRQTGKTTKLVEWLIQGHAIHSYPGWSRILVCANHAQVRWATDAVKEMTADWPKVRSTWDLRKAVWGLGDLNGAGIRGVSREVEIAVDNLDMVVAMYLSRMPVVVSMTGRPHEPAAVPTAGVEPATVTL